MPPFFMAVLLGAVLAAPPGTVSPKAEFKVWAVEVHSEGRPTPFFDKGLEEIRDALKDTKQDTFLNLKTAKHQFKGKEPVRTPLTDRYTLETTTPTRADDGRYRLTLKVTMKSAEGAKSPASRSPLLAGESLVPKPKNPGRPKEEIEAMNSKLLLQPDQKVVMRGFKLDDGKEMVLVVSLSVPEETPTKP